ADGTEHLVTLPKKPVAEGRVTDANTGQPISRFRVIPILIFGPESVLTSFVDAMPGTDGRYVVQFDARGGNVKGYRLRIDAEGYRTFISERTFGVDDGHVTSDFQLQPAPARRGTVVDASGQPVKGAEIIEGTPSSVPQMRDGTVQFEGHTVQTTE